MIKLLYYLFYIHIYYYKNGNKSNFNPMNYKNLEIKNFRANTNGIIILFLFCFNGWGNNGWGRGNNGGTDTPAAQGALTRADLCSEFNFNNLDRAVTGIQQGLCDGFYAMNTGILNGFNGVDNAICNLGYQTQNGFNSTNIALMQGQNALAAQLAQCCCDTRSDIKDVQFTNRVGQNTIQTQLASCCQTNMAA